MLKEISSYHTRDPNDYLSNTTAPPELLGASSLMNPTCAQMSAQRGLMCASHLPQAQIIHGCEHPRVFTGFESMIGEYEFDTTERNQDIQIVEIIPRFVVNNGANPLKDNPYFTIIYRGCDDNKIGYFNYEKFTMTGDNYGYKNKLLNINQLNKGNFIPKQMKLCTSPAHDGNKYMLGTNLNTAFISLPQLTEDAFVITESAAKKLASDGYTQISFKILPNQIPRDLYGDGEEYKFFPDIGEYVREDGVVCALMTPTADSFISDIYKGNISKIQYLHDTLFYAPKGSQVVDVNIWINRKCKVKSSKDMFTQAQKYRDHINSYNLKVWEAYQESVRKGYEVTHEFNQLVTDCLNSLLADNVRIPGFNKKADMTLVKKKEAIKYMYVTLTFRYPHEISLGSKLSGLWGNKGTLSAIIPDEDAPVDDNGCRAEILVDSTTVFNRMNFGQWYTQFFNRGGVLITQRIQQSIANGDTDYNKHYEYLTGYLRDINFKWADELDKLHSDTYSRKSLIEETIKQGGPYIQLSPFTKGIDQYLIKRLTEKYNIGKTPVEFNMVDKRGHKKHIRTKRPVMIAPNYWFSLYIIPHVRTSGLGYVSQYYSPVRAGSLAKLQSPISQTPIRIGEDEIRNIVMVSGSETAARILGMYANSREGLNKLGEYLMFSPSPSKLHRIDIENSELEKTNNIIGVAKHIFACTGCNITPTEEQVRMVDRALEHDTDH